MVLVDTNVLVGVLEDNPKWADWSISQLRAQSRIRTLAINPIIYSELSLTFSSVETLDRTLNDLGLELQEIPRPALFFAGKAFVRYRRQGGRKTNVLPDFFIGAHAAVNKMPILTRDVQQYATYFPSVLNYCAGYARRVMGGGLPAKGNARCIDTLGPADLHILSSPLGSSSQDQNRN